MIFIAAGTIAEAHEYARENSLKPGSWTVVHSVESVRGVRRGAGSFRTCGTFWRRRDSQLIYEAAEYRGLL